MPCGSFCGGSETVTASGRFRFGAERRWLMILVLAVLAPLAGYQGLHVQEQRDVQRAQEEHVLGRVAHAIGDRLSQEVEAGGRLLASLAKVPELSRPGHPQCDALLAEIAGTQHRYTNFSMVDGTRHIVCSSGPLPRPVDVGAQSNIRTAFETGRLGLSEFKLGLLTGRPVIVLSHPLQDGLRQVIGTLNTGLSLDWLQEHMAGRPLPPGTRAVVIGRDGLVLASSDPDLAPGMRLPAVDLMPVQTLLAGADTGRPLTGSAGGVLRAALLVEGLPGSAAVLVERQEAAALGALDLHARLWFAAFAILMALSLGAVYLTVDRLLLRRLERLSESARRFALGSYAGRADAWADGSGISALARDMDAMAADLEAREASLRGALDDMTRARAETARFAYIAAHDLQEPLRAIGGFTRLLEKRVGPEADETTRHYMGRVVGAAERMRIMFKELMDYALMDSGPSRRDPVDLAAEARAAADRHPGLAVRLGALPVIGGNRGQIRQLFSHLMDNAAQHATAGNGTGRVVVDASRHGALWEISVHDDGPGIPTEDHETVFHLFKKLNRRDDHPGSGIGLPMARRIAELHGGRMWISDTPAGGCDIRFTLRAQAPLPRDPGRTAAVHDQAQAATGLCSTDAPPPEEALKGAAVA